MNNVSAVYKTVDVNTSEKYQVCIGKALLNYSAELISGCTGAQKLLIITDDNVDAIYGEVLLDLLKKGGFEAYKFVFFHGELSKSNDTLMQIYAFLAGNHVTRSDCIIALGGGVVGDISGFAAATYLRGLDYVQIPTSLLAQVDSSVGGKTAIDLPAGKNLVGAFKQPKLVICDTDTLNTLPRNFLIDGMGEVIKYGMIKSAALFEQLENMNLDTFLSQAADVIEQCVSIKRDVVVADEFDRGERMLLNFGHTLGHSIEQFYHYSDITHGRAVAIGMYLITKLAEENGKCESGLTERLSKCMGKYELGREIVPPLKQLADACMNDKKQLNGDISIIICSKIGLSCAEKMPVSDFTKLLV